MVNDGENTLTTREGFLSFVLLPSLVRRSSRCGFSSFDDAVLALNPVRIDQNAVIELGAFQA